MARGGGGGEIACAVWRWRGRKEGRGEVRIRLGRGREGDRGGERSAVGCAAGWSGWGQMRGEIHTDGRFLRGAKEGFVRM